MTSREGGAVAELDRVPDVNAVLARLGLGSLTAAGEVATFPGRNENWAGATDAGQRVFVKRFGGPDGPRRMRRTIAFQQAACQGAGFPAPRLLGWDEESRLLVTEFIDGGVSGADLAADGDFGPDLALRAGEIIGSLHQLPVARSGAPADGRPLLPSLDLLRGLTLDLFYESSAGELKAWRLMQTDEALIAAIRALLDREEATAHVPAHCDLRLDQLLRAAGQLYVIDWEEFRLADPARDIGSFAGEWLYRAVTDWARGQAGGEPPPDEEIQRHCAAGIERARPTIAAFWSGYRQARQRDQLDGELGERAAAFAGWHLFDRLLAAARDSVRLPALSRAAAGIGRAVLCAPRDAAATIGLGTEC